MIFTCNFLTIVVMWIGVVVALCMVVLNRYLLMWLWLHIGWCLWLLLCDVLSVVLEVEEELLEGVGALGF